MRVALLNPRWTFEGSIYFGCREPHLPLELGAARTLLERDGHETLLLDAHLFDLDHAAVRAALEAFGPEMTVVTTAPTYLFWRCAQPELRVPQALIRAVREVAATLVAVGPHGSAAPRTTLAKLDADLLVMGECEEIVATLARQGPKAMPGLCWREGGEVRLAGGPLATRFVDLPALTWPDEAIRAHRHHHHRFDEAAGLEAGAEVEASRGCPYHCSFCAKEHFRDSYRRRDLGILLEEIDRLAGQGARYLYFVDEIFLPNRPLLAALVDRGLKFGIQTRIDLWKPEMIELLGRAGCVSIEAGVESITPEGRDLLAKDCRISTDELTERLVIAKQNVPFVQANLIQSEADDAEDLIGWRDRVRALGIWANDPVPLFPYPGSPDYRRLWGLPDEQAWERALDWYLERHTHLSELQEARPRRLAELEQAAVTS
jgi:B12-binding domain/radical SAM domain protein of rhizo-twelve system